MPQAHGRFFTCTTRRLKTVNKSSKLAPNGAP